MTPYPTPSKRQSPIPALEFIGKQANDGHNICLRKSHKILKASLYQQENNSSESLVWWNSYMEDGWADKSKMYHWLLGMGWLVFLSLSEHDRPECLLRVFLAIDTCLSWLLTPDNLQTAFQKVCTQLNIYSRSPLLFLWEKLGPDWHLSCHIHFLPVREPRRKRKSWKKIGAQDRMQSSIRHKFPFQKKVTSNQITATNWIWK